jgi:hypothetical protein
MASSAAAAQSAWADTCARYERTHARALRCLHDGRSSHACAAQQFLVFRAREDNFRWKYSGGLVGRLMGLLSTFALALSSEPMRAFLVDWPGLSGPTTDGLFSALAPQLALQYDKEAMLAAGVPQVWLDFHHEPWRLIEPSFCGGPNGSSLCTSTARTSRSAHHRRCH